VFEELYKAWLMPAASKADGFASVFKNVFLLGVAIVVQS
jgi:hypothetical protein